jgi:PPP family 3-phenylpropionic acid transporter
VDPAIDGGIDPAPQEVQVAGGLGFGFYYVAAVDLVHAVASERVSSTAQTVLTGAGIGFGGAVGQVLAGELYDLLGIQEMYLYLAAVGFLGAAVGLLVRRSGSVGGAEAVA